jgi:hypothetical protein
MLFPKIDADKLVQIQDMFRIDASKSFATAGEEITEVNIYPDFTNNPGTVFDVYEMDQDCWLLDWAYEVDGLYKIRLELKTAADTKIIEHEITAITEEEDNLLSNDNMLYAYEAEMRRNLPEGRNSWKYLHRKAQEEILDYLYRNAILNPDGSKIEKAQLIDDKLEKWSTFETLILIYQDLKTSNSEAFNDKLSDYYEKRAEARRRYLISYDSNKDGNVDEKDVPRATTPTFFSR